MFYSIKSIFTSWGSRVSSISIGLTSLFDNNSIICVTYSDGFIFSCFGIPSWFIMSRIFFFRSIEGDLHDIGKNLFIVFLRSMGFEVIDLGIDVPVKKFVDAVKQYKPDILAMSSLLTTTAGNLRKVIEALEREGLRDKVKVIVGGAAVSKEYAVEIGADAGGVDAYEGALICRKWVEEKIRKESS